MIRKENKAGLNFTVNEIYKSIQGESTWAGLPCTFIRFSGCNLRCRYCDTIYAYSNGCMMSNQEIISTIKEIGIHLVELTGGEPLLQNGISELITNILDEGYNLLVETNGTVSISGIDKRAVVIMDVKTPGSNMAETFLLENLPNLKNMDELKFVLTSENDYFWAKDFIRKYDLSKRMKILMSPAFELLEPRKLAMWIVKDNLPVRLNLQLHKYIWGADKRGV